MLIGIIAGYQEKEKKNELIWWCYDGLFFIDKKLRKGRFE